MIIIEVIIGVIIGHLIIRNYDVLLKSLGNAFFVTLFWGFPASIVSILIWFKISIPELVLLTLSALYLLSVVTMFTQPFVKEATRKLNISNQLLMAAIFTLVASVSLIFAMIYSYISYGNISGELYKFIPFVEAMLLILFVYSQKEGKLTEPIDE